MEYSPRLKAEGNIPNFGERILNIHLIVSNYLYNVKRWQAKKQIISLWKKNVQASGIFRNVRRAYISYVGLHFQVFKYQN